MSLRLILSPNLTAADHFAKFFFAHGVPIRSYRVAARYFQVVWGEIKKGLSAFFISSSSSPEAF